MGKFKPNQQEAQKQKKYNPLSGIKIAHDIEDFEEGQEVILTLEDQNILVGPHSNINEDNDKLENLQLKDKFKAQFNQDQKKLLAKGKNDYSEDKYEMERSLLPQYDEKKAEQSGFMLDENGEYNMEKLRKLDEIKKRLQAKSDNYQSLNTEVKVASEYEDNSNKLFKKPKRKLPKNQQSSFDNNPKNQKRKINDLIDFLEENAEDSAADLTKDHGNREKQKLNEKQEQAQDLIEKKQKQEKYEAALEQARQDTQITVEKYKKVQIFNEDDELDQLQQSILKSQKIMQERQNKMENDEVIKGLIEENKEVEIKNEQKQKLQDFEKIQTENKQQSQYEQSNDGKQQITTITTLTEFVKTIKTDSELKENEKKIEQPTLMKLSDTKHGTASILNISLPSDRLINQTRNSSQFGYQSVHFNKIINKRQRKKKQQQEKQQQQEQQQQEKQQNNEEDENIDLEKVVQDEEFMNQEMEFTSEDQLGSGLSGVLKKLQERGMLSEDQIDYSGRFNDAAFHTELNKFQPAASDKIKLEYRDETGKLMTPKEAFRYICHIFHGKRPGKNKRDKKMQKEQITQRQKFTVPTQESQHMKKLKQQQQKTNQPFLLLSQNKQNN